MVENSVAGSRRVFEARSKEWREDAVITKQNLR